MSIYKKLEQVLRRRNFWGLVASGILFQHETDHKVCLFLRSGVMQSGTWGIPGGKVDYSEDPKDSAIREVEEEIGGLPDGYFSDRKYIYETPLNTGDYISGDEDGGPDENRYAKSGDVFRYITYLYIVKESDWRPELNWEHKRVEWFGIDELPENTITIFDENGNKVKPLEIAIRSIIGAVSSVG